MTQTKTLLDIELTEFPIYPINRFCLETIKKIPMKNILRARAFLANKCASHIKNPKTPHEHKRVSERASRQACNKASE